jgi:hypothetical protein
MPIKVLLDRIKHRVFSPAEISCEPSPDDSRPAAFKTLSDRELAARIENFLAESDNAPADAEVRQLISRRQSEQT